MTSVSFALLAVGERETAPGNCAPQPPRRGPLFDRELSAVAGGWTVPRPKPFSSLT